MVDLEHISRHFLDLVGRIMTISSLIWNISQQLFFCDMKLSGIYTVGVSREQTKSLRIHILLKK